MKKTFLLFFLALVARAYAAQSDLPPLYTVMVDLPFHSLSMGHRMDRWVEGFNAGRPSGKPRALQ
jgi:hypothetical protein